MDHTITADRLCPNEPDMPANSGDESPASNLVFSDGKEHTNVLGHRAARLPEGIDADPLAKHG